MPLDPKQKPTPYKNAQTRTQINPENTELFADKIEIMLLDTTTQVFPEVKIRGIKGHGYYNPKYGLETGEGLFVGKHTEGEFNGFYKKAQSVSAQQLKILIEDNSID